MKRTEIAQNDREIGYLVSLTMQTRNLEGDLAEVGVFKGGSAWIISRIMDNRKKLYLFDTFKGFDSLTEHDSNNWVNDRNEWKTNPELINVYESVSELFKNNKSVEIIKGSFPSIIGNRLDNNKFCFVHLDADAYQVTMDSLNYFYPKMVQGGIIVLHDYIHEDIPVRKVCDEFLKDKPEQIVNIDSPQGFLIKL